jgi:repressor LexA
MLYPLTERQDQTVKAISDFIVDKNYPPTIPEIQKLLKINNPGAVHKCLCALERKGWVVREPGRHRGLDITQEAREQLQ